MRDKKGVGLERREGGEKVGGVEGEKAVNGIYYVRGKKIYFQLWEEKEVTAARCHGCLHAVLLAKPRVPSQ